MTTKMHSARRPGNSETQPRLAAEWIAEAARELGTTPATIEQWLYGQTRHAERLAMCIRKAIKHGNTQVAAHILAPILAAAQDIQPTPPSSDAYVRIQEANADLARDELNYRQTPTRERAIALRRGIERCVTTLLALRQGIEQRHEL